MKFLVLLLVIVLLIQLLECQELEALAKKVAKQKLGAAKAKLKSKDKKALAQGVGSAVKLKKGGIQKASGKKLTGMGIILGPLGIPKKIVGKSLKAKSALNKAAGTLLGIKAIIRQARRG